MPTEVCLLRLSKSVLLLASVAIFAVQSAYAERTIPLEHGEYRLGDSPQTPELGFAWLTVDVDSPEWRPYRLSEGHPAGEFTNVWRRFTLPDTIIADPTVYVPGWSSFEVYIDNELIYRAGVLHPDPDNKYAGHTFYLVPLPSDFGGKKLYLRVYSEQYKELSDPNWLSVASRSDHLISIVRSDLAQATAGLFLVLIALGALFVYIRRGLRAAFYLAFFSICVGAFTALHTDIANMLITSGAVTWYFSHIPLYAFPIGLWLFLDEITDHDCPALSRLAVVHTVYLVGATLADVLGFYPMYMTTPYMVLLSISIGVAVFVTFRHLHKQKSEPEADLAESKLLTLGFTILALAGTHDLMAGFKIIPFYVGLFHFGVLGFVLCLAIVLERRFTQAHEQLRAYSRDLEQRVDERTKDLGRKNEELEQAMSDLKEAQNQLVIREKMASLGDLVAGVAHEVNTPIGAVNSSADVADRCIGKLTELVDNSSDTKSLKEERGYLQAIELLRDNTSLIKNAGDRISRIVRSLRSFARLDEAEFQAVNIHEGIDSTLDLVHHQLKDRIEIEKKYGETVPEVECYPNQLNQVFMNLLVNASQAIDGSGTITITTESDAREASVSISDTGRGISQENLAHVFDPGFTTKGVGVGTGLGLSISYKIIEDHQGRIEAASELGVGSTFRVILPIKQDEH